MMKLNHLCMLVVAGIFAAQGVATGSIVESADLNIIDMSGNPSDGLRFLDMSFSDGLTQVAALANAQGTYANARLATPSEFDDLFAAAGISYFSTLTASDGFASGPTTTISFGTDYDGGALAAVLGYTLNVSLSTVLWTDPDASRSDGSTRDYVELGMDTAVLVQHPATPADANVGWLLVSESAAPNSAIPEPSSFLCWLGLGLVGWMKLPRNRKTRVAPTVGRS